MAVTCPLSLDAWPTGSPLRKRPQHCCLKPKQPSPFLGEFCRSLSVVSGFQERVGFRPRQCDPPGQNWAFCVVIVVGLLSEKDVILHRVMACFFSAWCSGVWPSVFLICPQSFPNASDIWLLNKTPGFFRPGLSFIDVKKYFFVSLHNYASVFFCKLFSDSSLS